MSSKIGKNHLFNLRSASYLSIEEGFSSLLPFLPSFIKYLFSVHSGMREIFHLMPHNNSKDEAK